MTTKKTAAPSTKVAAKKPAVRKTVAAKPAIGKPVVKKAAASAGRGATATKPVITLMAVFTFLDVWNDFAGPLIYLNDTSKFTLASVFPFSG